MLNLAKQALDVGLYTNRWDEHRAFWMGEVGLAYEELLKVGGGVHQHRLSLPGSVLKVNASREPLGDAPTGYQRLTIAVPGLAGPRPLHDPDGLPVLLVPPGTEGVTAIRITLASAQPEAVGAFWRDGLGTGGDEGAIRIGTTLLEVLDQPDRGDAGALGARGLRYLTVQVGEVGAGHAALLEAGGTEALAPRRLGDVAKISFVRDPDGNWLEVSQRASLTGPLPD